MGVRRSCTATEQVLAADDRAEIVEGVRGRFQATVVFSKSEDAPSSSPRTWRWRPTARSTSCGQTPSATWSPAGLMPDENDATVLLDGDASEATAVGITIEPDGGSPRARPRRPIALFELTA